MSVNLQILDPQAGTDPGPEFSANITSLCLAGESVTVTVLLVPIDFSTTPVSKSAAPTPVPGVSGVTEWSVSFGPEDGLPDLPFVLYALAYNGSSLTAEANVTLGEGGVVPPPPGPMRRKGKGKKGKKIVKKVVKKK